MQAQYHVKWKEELRRKWQKAAKVTGCALARYKRYHDARLRKIVNDLQVGGKIFVRVERLEARAREKHRSQHKIAPIASGPFRIDFRNRPNAESRR